MKPLVAVNVVIVLIAGLVFVAFLRMLEVSGSSDVDKVLHLAAQILISYLLPLSLIICVRFKALQTNLLSVIDLTVISVIGSLLSTVYTTYLNLVRDWDYVGVHRNQLYRRHIEPQITFFIMDTLLFFFFSLGIKLAAALILRLVNSNKERRVSNC
jgi:hypothetical protein